MAVRREVMEGGRHQGRRGGASIRASPGPFSPFADAGLHRARRRTTDYRVLDTAELADAPLVHPPPRPAACWTASHPEGFDGAGEKAGDRQCPDHEALSMQPRAGNAPQRGPRRARAARYSASAPQGFDPDRSRSSIATHVLHQMREISRYAAGVGNCPAPRPGPARAVFLHAIRLPGRRPRHKNAMPRPSQCDRFLGAGFCR